MRWLWRIPKSMRQQAMRELQTSYNRVAQLRAKHLKTPSLSFNGGVPMDELVSTPYTLDKDGCVRPLERPGIGVEVDEAFLHEHPVIDGPGYV